MNNLCSFLKAFKLFNVEYVPNKHEIEILMINSFKKFLDLAMNMSQKKKIYNNLNAKK